MRRLITRNRALTISLVLLALATALSHAQDLASMTGVVTDTTGAVIPDASVVLSNDATNVTYKAATNSVGSYTISNVAPGPGYKITFSAPDFKTVVVTGIYLSVDATRTQDAKLSVGAESQTIQVSAASENLTLNTTDATVGNNFQVAELNDLPVADRDTPSALFYQQPGVTLDGAVTGARTDQTNVTLDGLEVNDNATGQFGDIVGGAPVDSVQEFRGVTAGELSSSGQGGGGQFELVTKSGTNSFHGNLNEYHRDTDLEANDWFSNNSGVPRAPLVRNQFGGNIGGPICRWWRYSNSCAGQNKAFFFFDWDSRRDTLSNIEDRTVPLGTKQNPGYAQGLISYENNAGGVTTLSASQMAALDPQGIGWDQAELALFQKRFPIANDLTGDVGDLVNTAGFRFNAPFPLVLNTYVQRVDYTINDKMKVFGRGTFTNLNQTYEGIQFPGDPETFPFVDKSYAWVAGHTWDINANMLNQFEIGENYENFAFNIIYNPEGANQFGFGGVSSPYFPGNNSQARLYPIPVVRDDFSWEKGKHSFTFGGTFKWETPNEYAAENFNFPTIGVAGNSNFTALTPAQRPSDISTSTSALNIWDLAFSTALGVVNDVESNFNYNNKAQVLTQGSGLALNYRNYETEVYFGDTWKLAPNLDISYGVRYQNYTVPYETNGYEAVPSLTSNGSTSNFTFDSYWKARVAQSAAGNSTNASVPFLQYMYGGKVNNAPGYFQPMDKLFAPRVAFAYSPFGDTKTVFRGGAGVIYDHSEINALQFLQFQTSELFEASNVIQFGVAGDPAATLMQAPRFAGIASPPPISTSPAISSPFAPFVFDGAPYGLPLAPSAAFNLMMDPALKNPYNIQFTFGWQHEFPQGYILKADYVGRLGRRLLAQADASQLIDFPDNTGGSNQLMSQAFGAAVTQLRSNVSLGEYGAVASLGAQPWFEDMLSGLAAALNNYYGGDYFANNTQAAMWAAEPYSPRGDFADTIAALAASGFLAPNVGMAWQYSADTVWTNKGSSAYHGLLVTLHKNAGYGLRFDLNYTWSHSIDNVSEPANFIAANVGFGFLCDVSRPRECRANSDFDAATYLNGNVIYELPFGHDKTIGATVPYWMNELIGGWELSGLPSWHTGNPYNAYSNAFIASFANDAPATLIGPPGAVRTKISGGKGQPLFAFANPAVALAGFTGPTGFDIGSRNNLRGPGYFNLDLGLGKTFPVYEDKVNLKFRCDAFNVANHPSFNAPSGATDDITEAEGQPFGAITSTASVPRVLQGSLRLEF